MDGWMIQIGTTTRLAVSLDTDTYMAGAADRSLRETPCACRVVYYVLCNLEILIETGLTLPR